MISKYSLLYEILVDLKSAIAGNEKILIDLRLKLKTLVIR